MRPLRPLLAAFAVLVIYVLPAEAIDIKEVKSKAASSLGWSKITQSAHRHAVLLHGGAANDPAGKEGTQISSPA